MSADGLGKGLEHSSGYAMVWFAQKIINRQEFYISKEERWILRDLASRIAELAAKPIQEKRKKLWYKHNDLDGTTRPLVTSEPANSWYEIIPPETLKCKGNLAKITEFKLRKLIYQEEYIKDDTVLLPAYTVQYVFTENDRGLKEKIIGGGVNRSFTWEPALHDYDEIEKLQFIQFHVDEERTRQLFDLINDTFGDIIKVELEGFWSWTHGMTWDLVYLIGLEKMMMDMALNPDGIHKAMTFLRDEKLAQIDYLEKNNYYTLNGNGLYFGSGGYAWTKQLPQKDFDPEHVRPKDLWVFSESQETVGISPEMFEELIFPYQLALLEKFGKVYYGCCEGIHQRWHIIKRIPNLRRISVSPYTNEEFMAEHLGGDYVYVRKTPPTWVADTSIDEDATRKGIMHTLKLAKKNNCRLEFVMKDTHTISNNPNNLIRFVEIARECIDSMQ